MTAPMAVACVGSGLIGRSWPMVFARGGHKVRLWDESSDASESALAFCARMLPELEMRGLLDVPAAVTLELISGCWKGPVSNRHAGGIHGRQYSCGA